MSYIKIAIDGPSGAGKSSIAKAVSKLLGFTYIDTGAMYRALALAVLDAKIDAKDHLAVSVLLDGIQISIHNMISVQQIFLNGVDVTFQIRDPKVSVMASDVSVIKEVRIKMLQMQRDLAKKDNVIMDGRDIGTHVLPDANVKIFLTASLLKRSERRFAELLNKGFSVTFESVKSDIEYRDNNDSSREIAPLSPTENSIILDTTDKTLEQSIALVYEIIKERT